LKHWHAGSVVTIDDRECNTGFNPDSNGFSVHYPQTIWPTKSLAPSATGNAKFLYSLPNPLTGSVLPDIKPLSVGDCR
jgi:hypothetical protein